VLITRSPEQSGELAARLRALGAEPVEVPTIAVGPPDDWAAVDAAISRLESFDWLVLTSVNGVRYLRERLAALPAHLKVAAVGPKTAEAARSLGWEPALVPERTHGEGLAEALADEAAGRRFLLTRGNLALSELPDGLRAAGGLVEEVVVYVNRPGVGSLGAIAGGRLDWALFASGSAFRNLVAMLEDPAMLHGVKLVSIGPKTSEVMRQLGFEPAVEATESTLEGLVAALTP
jgi:uroporphyrinogen III methyltransferase/synthase